MLIRLPLTSQVVDTLALLDKRKIMNAKMIVESSRGPYEIQFLPQTEDVVSSINNFPFMNFSLDGDFIFQSYGHVRFMGLFF